MEESVVFDSGGFEIFFNERQNLGGFWDFFLKNPSKLKKISQKEWFDPQNPSLNTPLL